MTCEPLHLLLVMQMPDARSKVRIAYPSVPDMGMYLLPERR
jgi:hypothetical protein